MRNGSYEVYEGNGVTAWGSLTLYGRFALATSSDQWSVSRAVRDEHAATADARVHRLLAGFERWRDRVAGGTRPADTGCFFPACRRSRSRFRQRS